MMTRHSSDGNSLESTATPSIMAGEDPSRVWDIDPKPLLETPREQVLKARHKTSFLEVWFHIVKSPVDQTQDPWNAHFSNLQDHPPGPDHAALLSWGLDDGKLFYITQYSGGEPLQHWKLRRQASSATSIRMRLMLQAIQAAKALAQQSSPRFQLSAALTTVNQTISPDSPYRLQWNTLLAPTTSDPVAVQSELVQETGHILNIITAGMPWPVELTRAFQDSSQSAAAKLTRCEKILQAQLLRSASPTSVVPIDAQPRAPRNWLAGTLSLTALLSVPAIALYVWSQLPEKDQVTTSPPPAPQPDPEVRVGQSYEAPMGPTEISIAREKFETAKVLKHPAALLRASRDLLEVAPNDIDATAEVKKLLRQELRRQLEMSKRVALVPENGWSEWTALGFDDAALLDAIDSWTTRTSDAKAELQALARKGSIPATVLLGQIMANAVNTVPDYEQAVRLFQTAADANDSSGMALLGEAYLLGRGLPAPDKAKGTSLLTKAAEAGDDRAMFLLGNCLVRGDGIAKDIPKAADWFAKAAAAGNERALANLATLYLNGDGVVKDLPRAIELLQRGEKLESTECLYLLGECHKLGKGVIRDLETAGNYFQRAADLDHPKAMFQLGMSHATGEGRAKDAANAIEWLTKASEAGNTNALAGMAAIYAQGNGVPKDPVRAFQLLQQGETTNNPDCLYQLGEYHLAGIGIPKNEGVARQYFNRAAELGHGAAMWALGQLEASAKTAAKDMAKTAEWYVKSVETGFPKAIASLAALLMRGEGVAKNTAYAISLLERGAELNDPESLYLLGEAHRDGTGVPKNLQTARFLFERSASLGETRAISWLKDHPNPEATTSRTNL